MPGLFVPLGSVAIFVVDSAVAPGVEGTVSLSRRYTVSAATTNIRPCELNAKSPLPAFSPLIWPTWPRYCFFAGS